MKPYTTIKICSDGTRYLPIQLRGATPGELAASLQGSRLLECKVPETQKAGSVWQVILNFTSNLSLELTSSSTVAQGWDEIGTINVEILSGVSPESTCDWISLELPEGLEVAQLEIIRWHGAGLVADSGIRLDFIDAGAFSAVALDMPGELLLTMPGDASPTAWQFPAHDYCFVALEDVC